MSDEPVAAGIVEQVRLIVAIMKKLIIMMVASFDQETWALLLLGYLFLSCLLPLLPLLPFLLQLLRLDLLLLSSAAAASGSTSASASASTFAASFSTSASSFPRQVQW